jgi:hypothetical protein
MSTQWDLAAYNRDNQFVLGVEVKSKLEATPQWAAQFRRNLLAHGVLPNAPYFLLACPDQFFLWDRSHNPIEIIEPGYVIDVRPLLRPYFNQANIAPERVSGRSLELIVSSWLGDIMRRQPDELSASDQWLVDSGLYRAVAGGRLDQPIAA